MKKYFIWIILVFSFNVSVGQLSQIDHEDQHLPSPMGGKKEVKRLFEQQLIYPSNSLAEKKGGKVELKFTVKEDSTVSDITVTKSVNTEIDQEAVRIFKKIRWIPACEVKKSVAAQTYITFNFQPGKYKDIIKERGYEAVPVLPDKPSDNTETIYYKVDKEASYIDGNAGMNEFIYKNLTFPDEVKQRGISGNVVLKFVVEPNGFTSNMAIVQGIGGGCDQEALRIGQMMKWKPAVKNNMYVRSYMSVPIRFQYIVNYR